MKRMLLLPLLITAVTGKDGDDLKQADLAKLLDPALCPAEVARLADCDGKERLLNSFRLHRAPQRDPRGELMVLAAAYDYHFESSIGSDRDYKIEKPEELFGQNAPAAGSLEPALSEIHDSVLLVFGSDGKEVRPFGGNNYINAGYLYDLNRDGILDRADSTSYSIHGAKDHDIEVFELETVERTSRCLLRVAFNWHPRRAADSNTWTFTCRDEDGDGFAEIAFGPEEAAPGAEKESFVFRWDPQTKRYSAGDIPARSHIRVLHDGETLEQIAKEGGLGYPLLGDPADDDDDDAPAVRPAAKPYTFVSLQGSSDADVLAFFRGKERRDWTDGPEDSVETSLPAGFWDMDPRKAALAFADSNRTASHRKKWRLVIDDRSGITPPKSGWVLHDWGSSGCYSYSSHVFAIRFGTARPGMMATDYNSHGVVGANPLADQPGFSARWIDLSEKEARFLADTLFWLDRIRSRSSEKKSDSMGGMSSTADGFGTLHLLPDGAPPNKVASATVWAIRAISANWDADYSPEVCLNLAEHLLATALPAHLGKRWQIAPEIDRRSLATPLEQRLKPRHDMSARDLLTEAIANALKRHQSDPLPAPVLEPLVRCAGEEGLLDLLPALEALQAALPPPGPEDAEFQTLEKRFDRDHFGTPTADDPSDHPKDYARYEALLRKRELEPAPVLRKPLAAALQKLRIAGKAEPLLKQARGNDALSTWALARLRLQFPDRWADYLIGEFKDANLEARRTIFETLAAARPEAAKDLIALLSTKELDELSLEVTEFQIRHDPAAVRDRVPALLTMIRQRKEDYIRRGEAMRLLGSIKLDPPVAAELLPLLLAEIKDPQKGEYPGAHTSAEAIDALSRLPGAAAHLDEIVAITEGGHNGFETGIDALLRLTRDLPDRNARLEAFIRPRLKEHDGMMNDVFIAALALDLRGLAPEIAALASESPAVQDGDAADYGGGNFKGPAGQRYHIAREITALWNEPDPGTRARMWLALIVSRSYQFSPEYQTSDAAKALRERAAAALQGLGPVDRLRTMNAFRAATPNLANDPETVAWLDQIAAKSGD